MLLLKLLITLAPFLPHVAYATAPACQGQPRGRDAVRLRESIRQKEERLAEALNTFLTRLPEVVEYNRLNAAEMAAREVYGRRGGNTPANEARAVTAQNAAGAAQAVLVERQGAITDAVTPALGRLGERSIAFDTLANQYMRSFRRTFSDFSDNGIGGVTFSAEPGGAAVIGAAGSDGVTDENRRQGAQVSTGARRLTDLKVLDAYFSSAEFAPGNRDFVRLRRELNEDIVRHYTLSCRLDIHSSLFVSEEADQVASAAARPGQAPQASASVGQQGRVVSSEATSDRMDPVFAGVLIDLMQAPAQPSSTGAR